MPPPAPASAVGALPEGVAPATPAGLEGVPAATATNGAAHIRLRMPTSRQGSASAAAGGPSGSRSDASGSGSGGGGEHGSSGWSAAEHEAGRDAYFVDWQVARMWRRPEGLIIVWLLATLLVGIITSATAGGALGCTLLLYTCAPVVVSCSCLRRLLFVEFFPRFCLVGLQSCREHRPTSVAVGALVLV